MKFDIYHLVVIDDITLFRIVSIAACDTLHLKYKYVSKRNHNAFLVEKFHRFLNKTIYIAISDIKTLGCFIESGIVTGCALNSAPIDGRSIIHNSLAIGRALKFHIDIYIYIYIYMCVDTLPQLTVNQTNSIFKYLRLTDSLKKSQLKS